MLDQEKQGVTHPHICRFLLRCMGLAAFFFAPGLALAEMPAAGDVPVFQNGTLFIPRVDTPDQLGQYQDVIFVPNADGTWGLVEGLIDGVLRLGGRNLSRVTPIVTDTFPVQVFLKVEGGESECRTFPRTYARLHKGIFEVKLFNASPSDFFNYDCAGYLEFTEIIPLPVYGLEAGTYTYRVFSLPLPPIHAPITPRSIEGSFQIPRKNSF